MSSVYTGMYVVWRLSFAFLFVNVSCRETIIIFHDNRRLDCWWADGHVDLCMNARIDPHKNVPDHCVTVLLTIQNYNLILLILPEEIRVFFPVNCIFDNLYSFMIAVFNVIYSLLRHQWC